MASLLELKEIFRNADAVCFDVDSTVIKEEGIDELAKFCGVGDAVAEMYVQCLVIYFKGIAGNSNNGSDSSLASGITSGMNRLKRIIAIINSLDEYWNNLHFGIVDMWGLSHCSLKSMSIWPLNTRPLLVKGLLVKLCKTVAQLGPSFCERQSEQILGHSETWSCPHCTNSKTPINFRGSRIRP